jgi:hypothetical protein
LLAFARELKKGGALVEDASAELERPTARRDEATRQT